jgi:hypothetical protein
MAEAENENDKKVLATCVCVGYSLQQAMWGGGSQSVGQSRPHID